MQTAARAPWICEAGRRRDLLIVYLAMPVGHGTFLGWIRAGRVHDWPMATSILYWIGAAYIFWCVYDVLSHVAARLLKPWQPGLAATAAAGATLAIVPVHWAITAYISVFQLHFLDAALRHPLPVLSLDSLIDNHLIAIIAWTCNNLALVHLFGIPRFGFAPKRERPAEAPPSAAAPDVPRSPAFLDRVGRPIGRLLALSAEQHYLRVIGDAGDDLILYRISDAVRELAHWRAGTQVHRSHWVAVDAIGSVERTDGGVALILRNGLRIPVSRSYRSAAAEAGLLAARPAVRAA